MEVDDESCRSSCAPRHLKGRSLRPADERSPSAIRYSATKPGPATATTSSPPDPDVAVLTMEDANRAHETGAYVTAHGWMTKGATAECANGQCFEATWSRPRTPVAAATRDGSRTGLDVDGIWAAPSSSPPEGESLPEAASFKTVPCIRGRQSIARDRRTPQVRPRVTGQGLLSCHRPWVRAGGARLHFPNIVDSEPHAALAVIGAAQQISARALVVKPGLRSPIGAWSSGGMCRGSAT